MAETTVTGDGRDMPAAPARAAAATDGTMRPYPSPIYAAYAIGVLMLITLNSLLDRYLPSLLVGPIRETLQISDTQISLIQGYAFALFFVLLSVPFGRLVDRTNRRNLIAFGLIVWSGTTVLCGFANNMWMLFLGRMGVGIGEACLQPAAYSLIADYVKPKYRGRALAVYFMSLTLGAGASMILGATVLHLLPKTALALPGLGVFEPWQVVFLIAGASGLVVTPLLFTVREPARRDHLGATVNASESKSSFGDFLRYLGANGRTFVLVYLCYILMSFSTTCVVHWAPTYFARQYGLPLSTVGVLAGAAMIVGAVIGSVSSGMLSDRWMAKDKTGARLLVGLVALGLFVPALLLLLLVDNLALALVMFAATTMASTMAAATSSIAIQDLVPNRMRGQAVALYVLFSGMLALGLGPSAVALVTDFVFRNDAMLGYSMLLVSGPTAVVSIIIGLAALKGYHRVRTALVEAAAAPTTVQ